ncbi:phosphatidylserine/phosphatidylglycerophosphate/cardiolipin synthase family protein [Actinoplanes sp. NPDC051343]|uniref:phosphatidylserine/phosphatidylglycerophosphate/ cardiolipin synthase family protein n=1 Tax=Actinoplanes sp. NPDC051343 TaxID=3363906 RepID=UPI0037991EA7
MLDVLLLRDIEHGGDQDQAGTVAARFAGFIDRAKYSLDLAIYDFRLSPALAGPVVAALTAAATRGVQVRLAYDAGKPAGATLETFAALGADPAPVGTAQWVREHFDGTAVQTKAITAPSGQLMHSKYIVRDVGHRLAAVWTGSANWTDDAWSRQENNLLTIPSRPLAVGYRADFDQLWAAGRITGTGAGDAGTTTADGVRLGWDFAPADGTGIDSYLVRQVTAARRRIVLASMVITSHPLLAALADAIDRGVDVSGAYDGGQMGPIAKQWHDTDVLAHWKLLTDHLVGKPSKPYTPTSVHDFMHSKILVADGHLATGSYNFSANAQRNAENQLQFVNTRLADQFAAYAAAIAETYR